MEALEILDDLGGVARRTLLGRSASARQTLDRAIASGEVIDVGGGWLARPEAPRALVAAARHNATITCESAAAFYDLPTLEPGASVHLAVPRRRRGSRRRVPGAEATVIHRESTWTRPEPTGFPLAPIIEVLGRALRCLAAPQAVVMVDAALNRGLVDKEVLERTLAGPGSARALTALNLADGGSRSLLETLARLTLTEAGLRVRTSVSIPKVGEVDLVVEDRVVVECDGFQYHSSRRQYQEDRRRDRELVALGYVVLRFTRDDVLNRPEVILAAVQRALAALSR